MKTHNDSMTGVVPTNWPFGRDRFSSAHDHQMNGLLRARGDFAIAGRIHSHAVGINTRPGTGNRYHSAVTGGKVNAQGHLLATSEQHERGGRKHESVDRIHPPESQREVQSPSPCPSRTSATCSSAIRTRCVNYHSGSRKVGNSDQQLPARLTDGGAGGNLGPRVADQELDLSI